MERQTANIVSVNGDAAFGHIIKARNQGAERCFSAAGRTDQRNGFAAWNRKIYMMEYVFSVVVTKGDVVKSDFSFYIGKRKGVGSVNNFRFCVDNLHKTAESVKLISVSIGPIKMLIYST